jgi:hypothetical protein
MRIVAEPVVADCETGGASVPKVGRQVRVKKKEKI